MAAVHAGGTQVREPAHHVRGERVLGRLLVRDLVDDDRLVAEGLSPFSARCSASPSSPARATPPASPAATTSPPATSTAAVARLVSGTQYTAARASAATSARRGSFGTSRPLSGPVDERRVDGPEGDHEQPDDEPAETVPRRGSPRASRRGRTPSDRVGVHARAHGGAHADSGFGVPVARKRMRPQSVTPVKCGNRATVDMLGVANCANRQARRWAAAPRTELSDGDGSAEQKSGRRIQPIAFAISRPGCPSGQVRRAFHSA
jgi:hypothetical protein